jgi:hypothetical protein
MIPPYESLGERSKRRAIEIYKENFGNNSVLDAYNQIESEWNSMVSSPEIDIETLNNLRIKLACSCTKAQDELKGKELDVYLGKSNKLAKLFEEQVRWQIPATNDKSGVTEKDQQKITTIVIEEAL